MRTSDLDLTDLVHFLSPCTDARDYLYAYDNKGTQREAYEKCEAADWYTWALMMGSKGVRSEQAHDALERFHEVVQPFADLVLKQYQERILPSWIPTTFTPKEDNPHYQMLVGMSHEDLYLRYLDLEDPDRSHANQKRDFVVNYSRLALTYLNNVPTNSPAYALWALKKPYSRTWFTRLYNGVRIYLLHSAHNSVQLLGADPHRSHDEAVAAHIRDYNRVFAHRFQEIVSFDQYRHLMVTLIRDNRGQAS